MSLSTIIRAFLPAILFVASVLFFEIFFSAVSFGGIGLFVLFDLLTN